jgi:pyridoxine kinase
MDDSADLKMFAGYPTFKGQVLNGQQLCELIEGLEANDLLYYTHLLTGI